MVPGAPPGAADGLGWLLQWSASGSVNPEMDLSSLAMRDLSSSTESFSDCICPESASVFPLTASLCVFTCFCRAFTAAVIWLAWSAVCCSQVLHQGKSLVSTVDCSLCTMSISSCTCVCSSTVSFETACAGMPADARIRANAAAARMRFRMLVCSLHSFTYRLHDSVTRGSVCQPPREYMSV